MPQCITAITPTKRDPLRAMIRVDGKVVATLTHKAIEELGLKIDTPWTEELARVVGDARFDDKAYRSALTRLNRKMMSRFELFQKLRRADHPTPSIDKALDKLQSLGLIDDLAFGRALLRELQLRKPAGPRLLRSKFMQKGLDRALIEQLLSEHEQDHDDTAAALKLAQSKQASLARLDPQKAKQRLWGMLARRGFHSDTISEVMQKLQQEA